MHHLCASLMWGSLLDPRALLRSAGPWPWSLTFSGLHSGCVQSRIGQQSNTGSPHSVSRGRLESPSRRRGSGVGTELLQLCHRISGTAAVAVKACGPDVGACVGYGSCGHVAAGVAISSRSRSVSYHGLARQGHSPAGAKSPSLLAHRPIIARRLNWHEPTRTILGASIGVGRGVAIFEIQLLMH